MILETIVSTVDAAGRPNFAPMGIVLEPERVVLRPFRTAVTWANLKETAEGVINFTDDVLLFARCALSDHVPPHHPAQRVRGGVLDDATHWIEFVVAAAELEGERGRFEGRIVGQGRGREALGFNRAKHAVVEATILATRLFLLGRDRVLEEFERLRPLVDKTGGAQEREAFDFLLARVRESTGEEPVDETG
jgi:uncharacterized protein